MSDYSKDIRKLKKENSRLKNRIDKLERDVHKLKDQVENVEIEASISSLKCAILENK